MRGDWHQILLSEVCEVVNGGTPDTSKADYWGGEHLWITPAEMGKRLSPFVEETNRKLTDEGMRNSSANPLPPYSVILSSRAPIGHLLINTKPMSTNQGCKGLVPTKKLNYKFLYFFLYANVDLLNALGTGTTFKELSGSKLKEVLVPLPPLPEQQRIVAILDQAFDAIETAKANTEKNLQYVRELFDNYLNNILSSPGERWQTKKLEDLCVFVNGDRGTNYPSKAHRTIVGIPFINAGHLTDSGIDMTKMDFISRERYNLLGNGKIQKEDILFCLRGSLGKYALVENISEGAIASSLVIVRHNANVMHKFLLAYFASKLCSEMIDRYSNGAAQPNLSAKSLSQFLIPFPSLNEQERIVKSIDTYSVEIKKLEIVYKQKLAELEELKKSILQNAFNGEL